MQALIYGNPHDEDDKNKLKSPRKARGVGRESKKQRLAKRNQMQSRESDQSPEINPNYDAGGQPKYNDYLNSLNPRGDSNDHLESLAKPKQRKSNHNLGLKPDNSNRRIGSARQSVSPGNTGPQKLYPKSKKNTFAKRTQSVAAFKHRDLISVDEQSEISYNEKKRQHEAKVNMITNRLAQPSRRRMTSPKNDEFKFEVSRRFRMSNLYCQKRKEALRKQSVDQTRQNSAQKKETPVPFEGSDDGGVKKSSQVQLPDQNILSPQIQKPALKARSSTVLPQRIQELAEPKSNKIKERLKMKELKDLAQCTFRPKIKVSQDQANTDRKLNAKRLDELTKSKRCKDWEKLEEIRKQKELQECTFTPETNFTKKRMSKSVHQNLFESNKPPVIDLDSLVKPIRNFEDEQKKRADKEMEECTFKPQLTAKSETRHRLNMQNRITYRANNLYDNHRELRDKKEKLKEQIQQERDKECTFAPKLNPQRSPLRNKVFHLSNHQKYQREINELQQNFIVSDQYSHEVLDFVNDPQDQDLRNNFDRMIQTHRYQTTEIMPITTSTPSQSTRFDPNAPYDSSQRRSKKSRKRRVDRLQVPSSSQNMFMEDNSQIELDDEIEEIVHNIFLQYDTDKSGYLEKRESLRVVNDVLASQGQQPATVKAFNMIFFEFDLNGDGRLSFGEMSRFVRRFVKKDEVAATVEKIWKTFDTDQSGKLNRKETLRFLNHFLSQTHQPPATYKVFNRFFDKVDLNGDGFISRSEMKNFVKRYIDGLVVVDDVTETIDKIWIKYDKDNSGKLDKQETFAFICDFLAGRGMPHPTHKTFNDYFNKIDINRDGQISKPEMAEFARSFLVEAPVIRDEIKEAIMNTWYEFDKDKSGYLERGECLRFLNDFITKRGRQKITASKFSKMFKEMDKNGDGRISKQECADFFRKFLNIPQVDQDIIDKVDLIWSQYDRNRSGQLSKSEAHHFINDFLMDRGRAAASHETFMKYFEQIDVNGDGQIDREEMAAFVKTFVDLPAKYDDVIGIINDIWYEFDTDRSGQLNRKETLKFVNAFLGKKGKRPCTFIQFNKYFTAMDKNGDNQISKSEMAPFIRNFLVGGGGTDYKSHVNPLRTWQSKEIHADAAIEMVKKNWARFDVDMSGYLDQKETIQFLNAYLHDQGKPNITTQMFNRFYIQFDKNGDGKISQNEMADFLRKCMQMHEQQIEMGLIIDEVWDQFDYNETGRLSKKDTMQLLNFILKQKKKPVATYAQYHKFFEEFNTQGDGYIQRPDMAGFIHQFIEGPQAFDKSMDQLVLTLFDKFDKDKNGRLDKKETQRLLNWILATKGKPQCTLIQFNEFFTQLDENGDGIVTRDEIAPFVKKFFEEPKSKLDELDAYVNEIWDKFDTDCSGKLDRRETLRFLNEFLAQNGKYPATIGMFNKYFDDIDVNGDGSISKPEMASFIQLFNNQAVIQDQVKHETSPRIIIKDEVDDIVQMIFEKYDTNMSGVLEKRETYRLLNDVLGKQGRNPASIEYFHKIFDHFDLNNDGVLSRGEMTRFVKKFFSPPPLVVDQISKIVNDLFEKYDTDKSGFLDRFETRNLVNEVLVDQGKLRSSYSAFNSFFEEFDLNGDGKLSRREMANFVRKFQNMPSLESAQIQNTVEEIWEKYDADGNGKLNRKETLKFLNQFLPDHGNPKPTYDTFTEIFDKADKNGDGFISKQEMAEFIQKFLAPSLDELIAKPQLFNPVDEFEEMVQNILKKYDTDKSGDLQKREALRLVNDVLKQQGKSTVGPIRFNRIFNKFDTNKDETLSASELTNFVREFMDLTNEDEVAIIKPPEDPIAEMVREAWDKFDRDKSGFLERRESIRFLNDFMKNQGRQPVTVNQFNRFFEDFDVDKDGRISKEEGANFFRKFLNLPQTDDSKLREIVDGIWEQFDDDNSGRLNKKETKIFLNVLLKQKGKKQTSNTQFNQIFDDMDLNGDGFISKPEMTTFIKNFLDEDLPILEQSLAAATQVEEDPVEKIVSQIFKKYDRNRNGTLDRKESFNLVNDVQKQQGHLPVSVTRFNCIFREFDVNRDGVLSESEVTKFVKKVIMPQQEETHKDHEKIRELFEQFDKDSSGFLDRRETLKLLDHILKQQGKGPARYSTFHALFEEFDINKDGVLSKQEMSNFVRHFDEIPQIENQKVKEIVQNIWSKYDTDGSNQLNRRETQRFLNDLLVQHNQPVVSSRVFKEYFDKIDLNGNGLVSKDEMADFVADFFNLAPPKKVEPPKKTVAPPIAPPKALLKPVPKWNVDQAIDKLFDQFDTDKSGSLEKRETLKMLDHFNKEQGLPKVKYQEFSDFFDKYDVNGDGALSKDECAGFIDKFAKIYEPQPAINTDFLDVDIDNNEIKDDKLDMPNQQVQGDSDSQGGVWFPSALSRVPKIKKYQKYDHSKVKDAVNSFRNKQNQ